jgi:diguanylate cyclase (GGDEF)-like protein
VSALIALSDIVFIGLNYQASLSILKKETEDWAHQAENNFNISLENKAISMQQLATFIAGDPRVASLFEEGKKAVLAEGGGPGKERAAFFRKELFSLVNPSWKNMTAKYDVRQLHFHLGPGSTSFLRAHRPEKYGDNMDNVRYTVVDVNQNHISTKGFETGRVYSGIRGVVPVFNKSNPDGKEIIVGALEAGTSFSILLRELQKNIDSDFAILFNQDHVYRNMWPNFIKQHFSSDRKVENFFIEETTGNQGNDVFKIKELGSLLKKQEGSILIQQPDTIQICTFPLRDYKASTDSSLPDSGKVVVWKDATKKMAVFNQTLKNNIFYAVLALLLVEILLYSTWEYSRKKLQNAIDKKTQELSVANENLEKLASLDGLTQLANRRFFDQHLDQVWRLNVRNKTPLSMILCDIDYFKRFNDTYGHPEGDECLKKVANAMQQVTKRPTDFVARYGGEEFVVVLSNTNLEGAIKIAEDIRNNVKKMEIDHSASDASKYVSLSFGISSTVPISSDDKENLIVKADQALYKAKNKGRNRIFCSDKNS